MNYLVPRKILARQGVAAVGGIAGGLGLMVIGTLWWPIGLVAGGIVTLIGLSARSSHEIEDRRIGTLVTAAGGLAVLSKLSFIPVLNIFSGLAGGFLGLATFGLLGMGVWNAVKFIKGLKSNA